MRYRPQIRSQHPSHNHLRGALNYQSKRVVVRLGSTTTLEQIYPLTINRTNVLEINTVEAIKNSASKLRMKQCFSRANISHADWWTMDAAGYLHFGKVESAPQNRNELPYPIIAKHIHGSRGTGNTLIKNEGELRNWTQGKTLSNYIFEKFHNYNREYRIHVTADGCFYTCRKMLRRDADRNTSWQRHDDNSVWILEENPSFDKPSNWNTIVEHCVRALNATCLDIAGFDVKVQSANDSRGRRRTNPEFIIIESNSACSHGEITAVKYKEELNRLIERKLNINTIQTTPNPTVTNGENPRITVVEVTTNNQPVKVKKVFKRKLLRTI